MGNGVGGAMAPGANAKPKAPKAPAPKTKAKAGPKKASTPTRAAIQKAARNLLAHSPAGITQVQTPAQIAKAARAAANITYAPAISSVKGDLRASDVQQGRITDWFGEYQKQLADIASQNANAYGTAQQQVGDLANRSSAIDAVQQQALSQAAQADASQRGATVGSANDQLAAQAAANRRSLLDTTGSMLAGQTANQKVYDNNTGGIAANQGVQAHLAESNTKGTLRDKLRQYLTQRGDAITTNKQKLTADERSFLNQQQLLNFNSTNAANKNALDLQKAKISAAEAEHRLMLSDKGYQLNVKKFGAAQAKDTYQRTHKLGPYKPPSSKSASTKSPFASDSVQAKAKDTIAKAVTYIRRIQSNPKTAHYSRAKLASALVGGVPGAVPALPQDYVAAALDLALNGYISPHTIDLLHNRKIRVNGLGYPTKPKAKTYPATPGASPAAPDGSGGQRPT